MEMPPEIESLVEQWRQAPMMHDKDNIASEAMHVLKRSIKQQQEGRNSARVQSQHQLHQRRGRS